MANWNLSLSYQDAPLNHVHGGVGEDLLLDDGQGELAEDAQGPGLNFRLKTSKFEFKFCFFQPRLVRHRDRVPDWQSQTLGPKIESTLYL